MKVLHFAGPSASGKTQLIEQLVQVLPVVQVVKWTHHPLAEDKPGSDTIRVHHRGVDSTVLVAPNGLVWRQAITNRQSVYQWLAAGWSDSDLVLVEGDKYNPHPKIWVGHDLPPATVNVCLVIGPRPTDHQTPWISADIPLACPTLDHIVHVLRTDWVHFTYTVSRSTHD